MAFGQASGPPAGQKQLDELATLLQRRGFDSFREARHPFGLTQRQAGGKFTSGEVTELIERLEAEAIVSGGVSGGEADAAASSALVSPTPHTTGAVVPTTPAAMERAARKRRAREEEVVTRIDAEVLASELVARGWCCIPPE